MPEPSHLERVLDDLVASYAPDSPLNRLETHALPNRRAVIEVYNHLLHVLYLGYFSTRRLTPGNLRLALAEHLLPAAELLRGQIERACAWEDRHRDPAARRGPDWCEAQVQQLLATLPQLREVLRSDVEAAFRFDPAAESVEEVVFSYPSIYAVTAYRLAHRLHQQGVPMIPRILTEHAHTRTGIDIHPGARIGRRFFIDHGTGVVIGATTVIGNDVQLYQHVTLGALSVRGDVERSRFKVKKRHPTLQDRVTVYAGTTILGGGTVIGADSVIGGNVWLTRSVPPGSQIFFRPTHQPVRLGRGGEQSMTHRTDVVDAIGNTPLIRLQRASERTGCEILGKAEWLNPGMSVKDRAAKFMVLDAERRGVLQPGGIIVEGTAGNTGIGLAMVGRARGYRVIIVIPETQTAEKKDMLRLFGAELVEVPAKPYANPNHYVHVAERLADQLGAFYANQWDNLANRQAHIEGTGPEIWTQTGGRVDGFVSAIGTGGTLSGTGQFLKEQRESITVALADPHGAKMYAWFTRGELATDVDGGSVTQGIGQGRVTGNVDGALVDRAYRIPDGEMVDVIDELASHEGLLMGGSAGINVAGAIRLAEELGPGHTIVTILCDHGSRYQSQLWSADFRRERGFPVPAWLEARSPIEPPFVDDPA